MIGEHVRKTLILVMVKKLIEQGSWCGETHIQKGTYFLQEFVKVPMTYDFILYKHGPFSFELRDELSSMRANGLLGLVPRPPYGSSFKLNDFSNSWINNHQKEASRYFKYIDEVVNILADKKVKELERLATALYVKKRNPNRDKDQMVAEVTTLKPHITKDEALQAFEMLEKVKKAKSNC